MAQIGAANIRQVERIVREGARLRLARILDDDRFDGILEAARVRRAELTGKPDRPRTLAETHIAVTFETEILWRASRIDPGLLGRLNARLLALANELVLHLRHRAEHRDQDRVGGVLD